MASAGYGPVSGGKVSRDDEDGLVDEWGVRYEGHHKPAGGTYHGTYGKKRNSRRKFMYMAAGGVVILILIIIIAVAVQKHNTPRPSPQVPHKQHFGKWQNNSNDGLTMYPHPDDGSMVIKYDVGQSGQGGYEQYEASLEANMHAYQLVNQQGTEFTFCNKSYTPLNKVCKFDSSVLSPCDRFHHYGYSSGQSCVMLKLNLPINVTAVPFDKDSEVAKKLGKRYKPDYIGVTCDGVTEEDRKNVDVTKGQMKHIEYFPPEGFPAWWFRPRTINKFLPPIMMVRFNTLDDFKYIRIKCTTWAKNFNNGQPDNSTKYSTTFVINHI